MMSVVSGKECVHKAVVDIFNTQFASNDNILFLGRTGIPFIVAGAESNRDRVLPGEHIINTY